MAWCCQTTRHYLTLCRHNQWWFFLVLCHQWLSLTNSLVDDYGMNNPHQLFHSLRFGNSYNIYIYICVCVCVLKNGWHFAIDTENYFPLKPWHINLNSPQPQWVNWPLHTWSMCHVIRSSIQWCKKFRLTRTNFILNSTRFYELYIN